MRESKYKVCIAYYLPSFHLRGHCAIDDGEEVVLTGALKQGRVLLNSDPEKKTSTPKINPNNSVLLLYIDI